MKKLVWLAVGAAGFLVLLRAQDIFTSIDKTRGKKPVIALPDLKGSGETQAFMGVFNQTLMDDVKSSGVVEIAPKTSYPLFIPQQPSDFSQPPVPSDNPRARRNEPPPPTSGGGRWMIDWSGPP